ncbi:MAG: FAD-dependent oxidoreductase [Chloroflexota bacterium]
MAGSTTFRRLLEPLQIKQVRLRNRLVKTPQDMGYSEPDGSVSLQNLGYYEALAKGGVGAIIVEHACIDAPLGKRPGMINADEDRFISSLAKLAEVIHRHGCPVFQQINHMGTQYDSASSGVAALAPAALSEDYMRRTFGRILNLRELTVPEIQQLVAKFAAAAERVKKAGFDGVEIHADHMYLLNNFLSRVWNKRDDEYGSQTYENRTRFAVEVLKAARERVGQDFVIGVKINGAEYGEAEGTTSRESQAIARILEAAGADYLNVAGDGYHQYVRISLPEQIFYPEPPKPMLPELAGRSVAAGMCANLSAAIKKVVSVPVISVGRLDPVLGERMLREGMADAIALGRRLFADPELPNKVAEGRPEDIAPCTACGTCGDRVVRYEPVVCQVNAAIGKEYESGITMAEKRKRVVVVGGGPSGMEAARVAAMRGHEVTLYEKAKRLGGLLPLAAMVAGVDVFDFPALVRYLQVQIIKLGVNIKLGEEFTPETGERVKPDVVILATGGQPDTPGIPGIERSNVLRSGDLHRRVRPYLRRFGPRFMARLTRLWLPVGKKVLIIGGLIQGCETAEFLVKRGRKVTIVEKTDQPGVGIPDYPFRVALLKWLAEKGTAILTGVKFREITERGLVIIDREGIERTIEADTILVAVPPKPNIALLRALEGKVPEVYLIGDGREPRLIIDAIADGFRVGRVV